MLLFVLLSLLSGLHRNLESATEQTTGSFMYVTSCHLNVSGSLDLDYYLFYLLFINVLHLSEVCQRMYQNFHPVPLFPHSRNLLRPLSSNPCTAPTMPYLGTDRKKWPVWLPWRKIWANINEHIHDFWCRKTNTVIRIIILANIWSQPPGSTCAWLISMYRWILKYFRH